MFIVRGVIILLKDEETRQEEKCENMNLDCWVLGTYSLLQLDQSAARARGKVNPFQAKLSLIYSPLTNIGLNRLE
jgi:hypothetical protein